MVVSTGCAITVNHAFNLCETVVVQLKIMIIRQVRILYVGKTHDFRQT